MKVLERVLEKRIRCQVSIDNMQFSLMSGREHQAKKKKLSPVKWSKCRYGVFI